jgi:hypothetical protein
VLGPKKKVKVKVKIEMVRRLARSDVACVIVISSQGQRCDRWVDPSSYHVT